MEKNLTTGSVGRQLIGFSLPYLLSYLLQTLYGMADLFIIGQYEGVAGTTAVAVGSQVMHMLTVMIVGLAMGTTVSIARAIGADDRPQAAAATGNTVTLFLSLSLVLTVGLLLLRRPITAVGIVEKIIGFLFLVPSSMLSAVSALGAQDLGAGKPERAEQTLFWAIGLACGFGAVTVVAVQFLAEGGSGGPVHAGPGGGAGRGTVSARVHLGQILCRGAVQLQRLFLRLRAVRAVVSA